ncbi:barstar family protein [Streptomyces sp. SS7]|uniref:barstar family protein n=1 Tax=Streptomyces sp. SS7 TaxID=3108485 RepID=UPI0030EE5461
MRLAIDGADIRSQGDFHAVVSRLPGFGPYYGANLSALWDCLTVDVERPVEIVWKDSELSARMLGQGEFAEIRDVLLRVQAQDEAFGRQDRFTVTFE